MFEKVHEKILGDVAAGSPAKRWVVGRAVGIGRRTSQLAQARKPFPRGLDLELRLAHRLVFSKVHTALGGQPRFAVAAGARLRREIAEFFHAVGILIVEGYGLTEACPALTFNRIDHFRFGTVGQPIVGVEFRIATDGEILAKAGTSRLEATGSSRPLRRRRSMQTAGSTRAISDAC